jgi:ribosome biogenesis protein MAK21
MSFNFQSGMPWYQLLFIRDGPHQTVPGHEAHRLLQRAKQLYAQYRESQGSDELTSSILESGTLPDKFTAMRVTADENPLFSLPHLSQLNEMMRVKPRIALEAMHTAEHIFTHSLLPDRLLKKFGEQPLHSAKDSHLVIFYFEDQLLNSYADFITNIERLAKGQQSSIRDPAIRCLGNLLKAKPQCERVLLTILVDKFGDPLKTVSTVAATTILTVLKAHPQMTEAVIAAVNSQQPKFSPEAKQRALKFLAQLKIDGKGENSARELYETIRPRLLEELAKGEAQNSKVLQALMRSAEKCAAVCSTDEMATLIDPLYAFTESATLGTSFTALQLLFSIHKAAGEVPARFYDVVYQALLHEDFQNASKQTQFMNLILDVLMAEQDPLAPACFVHRLLHVGLHMNASFVVAALILVGKLFEAKPDLQSLFTSEDPKSESDFDFQARHLSPNALNTFPWILSIYVTHFHPVVRELAANLISQSPIAYDGDPFDEFATTKQLKRAVAGAEDDEAGERLAAAFAGFDEIPAFEEGADLDVDPAPKRKKKRSSAL